MHQGNGKRKRCQHLCKIWHQVWCNSSAIPEHMKKSMRCRKRSDEANESSSSHKRK
ncbi:hypothetical protein GQ600_24010 [Phytophthora cactorum]|nr:hypothetical protein GQ600_24010 [Phytophthora cactorum]